MTRFEPAPIGADGEPRWRLVFEPREASLLGGLPEMLRRILADPQHNQPVVDRLFPRTYQDEQEELEHRRLLGRSLLDGRRELLDSIDADLQLAQVSPGDPTLVLAEPDLDRWLRFLNDVRLALATRLGIEQNLGDAGQQLPGADDPDAVQYALLEYLGGLEFAMVEAIQRGGGPPPAGPV